MAAGRVGGGRGGGRAGGPKGPSGASGPTKAGGDFKTDRTAPAAGSVVSGGMAATAASPMDPVTLRALEIAAQLKQGQIEDKRKATEKLVDDILRRKLRTKSAALTGRITDALQDDPHVSQLLERLWAKG